MTCEDCNCIHEGDVAEHIMNTDVFGVVIGMEGTLVTLRLSPTLLRAQFHSYELRRVDTPERDPGEREEPPVADDNVIEFTKARKLRADTKTKGSA